MELGEYHHDEPLTTALESDLMNTPISSQVVPQIHCRDIFKTSLEPIGVRASQFSVDFNHLGLDANFTLLN